MDPMLTTAAFACAEATINQALRYDPATRDALARLAPQVLAIQINVPAFKIFIAPSADGVRVLGHYEGEITTQLQGSLPALIHLLMSERINLKDTGVELFGSSHFLGELKSILQNLDIDWEEILSQFTGDIVGHQAAELIRHKLNSKTQQARSAQRLASEFITEELRLLPSKPELNYFYQQVDELQLDTDRIAARLHQLHAKLFKPAGQQDT